MSATVMDRRSGVERRTTTFAAYWHGARNPRRLAGRRASDHRAVVDWHSPRLLIPVFAILCLCALDGWLTVLLMTQGAREVNPVMALFLPHNLVGFAFAKLALTGLGLCVLVACSRMRFFSTVRGEVLVYAVLGIYVWLIRYELRMLEFVASRST